MTHLHSAVLSVVKRSTLNDVTVSRSLVRQTSAVPTSSRTVYDGSTNATSTTGKKEEEENGYRVGVCLRELLVLWQRLSDHLTVIIINGDSRHVCA